MMLSRTVCNMLSQGVRIGAQRRTLNDRPCCVCPMSGIFLDIRPLSHYTAGLGER